MNTATSNTTNSTNKKDAKNKVCNQQRDYDTPELPGIPKFLKVNDLMKLTGAGRSALFKQVRTSLLPKPVRFGGKEVFWLVSDIQRIVDARVAHKSDDEIKLLVKRLEAEKLQAFEASEPAT